MGSRPKHPNKDIEEVILLIEIYGWRVERGRKYYKCYCPCGHHLKTIHLTPSGTGYVLNLRKWFQRQPCWAGGDL
jgi:hypothetical protein